MAQRKFIIDGGFKTDDASELLADLTMGGTIDMSGSKILDVGAPTLANDAASKTYVDTLVADTINSAPDALNTLNELAAALGDDANFSTTITTSLGLKADTNYVNAQITLTESYADTAEADAVIAAEAKDAVRATASDAYADASEAAAISSAVATASADASSKADAAEAAAKTHADTASNAAITSADATSRIYTDAAEVDAIAAAELKDVARMVTSDAYADASEAAAIASAESKDVARMVTSDAYADASEAAAVATASADATSKANAAQSAAISSASSDATTKANAAQAAAISTASSDATTKANAAQAAAVSAVTNGAGAAFDTLKEIQDAMATDTELSTAISNVTSSAASTAAADATTKADAALAAAKVYADANDANTTYSVGNGGLTEVNFTSADNSKLDGIAASATNVTNNNQISNGAGYITSYVDTNTTYTAGNGMSLSGTEFLMSGSYTGSFTATGDITAYSDDSLKTNVQVIDGALGRVEAIRGVTFERIEDGSVSTGVIAQELKAVLPEAVHTDAEGIHSVAYGNITGLLIEAVKELSAQVAELKAK